MKTKTIFASLLAASLLSSTVFAQSHVSGGVSGSAGSVVAPRTGITPVRPNVTQPGTTTQNGLNRQTVPPGQITTTSSDTLSTNNNLASTNGLGTNNLAGTNGGLGFGGTNSIVARVNPLTNFPVNVNTNINGNVVAQDQAVTPSDRVLLTTLSQGVRATLGIVPNGNTPVHFLIQNGTVTVVGTVQSTAQTQAVLSQVQATPGVLSVVNDMHVAGAYAPAVQNQTGSGLLGTVTDRAFSAADQQILTTVEQEAALQLGVTATTQMPVHFSIENGVVGVTGQVSSLQEKQALLATLQRTTGIVRVVDNVGVAPGSVTPASGSATVAPSSATSAFGATPGGNFGSPGNGTLTPTSRSFGTNFLPTTNSSGF